MRPLGHPLYVNGQLFREPVTISHVPGPTGAVDPSMGALGSYVYYAPVLDQAERSRNWPALASDFAPASAVVEPAPTLADKVAAAWKIVGPLAGAAGIYHGYARNHSILWGIWWGVCAAAFPVITIPIALAQGFGKKKGQTPNRQAGRRRRNSVRRYASFQSRGFSAWISDLPDPGKANWGYSSRPREALALNAKQIARLRRDMAKLGRSVTVSKEP